MKRLHGMLIGINGFFMVMNIFFIWSLDNEASIINYIAAAVSLFALFVSMWLYFNGDEVNG